MLFSATAGKYTLDCRFANHAQAETLTLIVGKTRLSQRIAAGATTATFKNVPLKAGNLRLKL